MISNRTAIEQTQQWLEMAVIGLNLCPFAKAVHTKNQIRWVCSSAKTAEDLLGELMDEMQWLAAADPEVIDTTLLIHPFVLTDFLDFNDFLDVAEAALEELKLGGVLQIASFHPQFQFADTDADDMGNCSNRSPFPTLHLLREDSVEKAVAAFPQAEAIFEKNLETLQRLGKDGWQRLMP